MTHLRLIADDLTGALDTAAQFVGVMGTVPVCWRHPSRPLFPAGGALGSIAVDSGTREVGPNEARATVGALVAAMPKTADALYYAKLDSLLRGNAGVEIVAWLAFLKPTHCIIAPAFPFNGRITRDGTQRVRTKDGWQSTGVDLCDDLERLGVPVRLCRPGYPVPSGVSLWDAECEDDLAAIVEAGRAVDGIVLWCGSGGLAGVLAGRRLPDPVSAVALPRPVLGLFGTNHPVMAGQLAECHSVGLSIPDGSDESATLVQRRIAKDGVVLANLGLPAGISRQDAAIHIARQFGELVGRLDRPGTLLVAGGETLRGLCLALGADRLDLDGQIVPGVPCSLLRGGGYDGVRVISKSGAFGEPRLLRQILALDELITQGDHL